MEYWTIIDDRHVGPFTIDELIGMGVKPDSPVWTSGLPDWVEASEIEEVKNAIEQRDRIETPLPSTPAEPEISAEVQQSDASLQEQPYQPCEQTQPYQPQPYDQPCGGWQQSESYMAEPCPPSYLAWSIIVTLLCCQILGIAAIICSALTKQAYNRGNLAKAKRMSNSAQWLIIISIVLGLISLPLQVIFMGL